MKSITARYRRKAARCYLIFSFVLFIFVSIQPSLHAQQRRRVAVMSFDVTADAKQNAAANFNMRGDLGRDLSDLVIQKLVNDGKVSVIERSALDKVLKEQDLSNSDRNDAASAAKIGKIAGVSAIIIGTVSEFGGETKEKTTAANGGIFGKIKVPQIPGTNIHQQTSHVTVKITARIIDTSTAEILGAFTGQGEESGSKTDMQNSVTVDSTNSKDFANSIVGKATLEAVNSVASQFEQLPSMAPPAPTMASYNGMVADVSGNTLILTVGSKAGVRVGDVVNISRVLRTVKDPETGAVLKVVTDPVGQAKITEIDENSATATYQGKSHVEVKDRVTSAP